MKRNWKKVVFVAVLFVMVLGCAGTTQAASAKWKKACKAYKTFLTKNVSKYKSPEIAGMPENTESYKKISQFLILDMDKNGVPELLAWHPVSYKMDNIYVYTYKNGKVKKVKNGLIALESQAAGWCSVEICKKGHVHMNWNGGWIGTEESVYQLKKGNLKLYAKSSEISMAGLAEYQINGKNVSSTKYQKTLAKCKMTNKAFYQNTKANRKKYVK